MWFLDDTITGESEEYKVIGKLHESRISVVFRAIGKKSGRSVAIKRYSSDKLPQLERERAFVNLLDGDAHPNILLPEEFFEFDGGKYIVYSYFESINAERSLLIQFSSSLKSIQLIGMFCKIFDAMEFIHDYDVIHRDIKLSNILLGRKDENIDFENIDARLIDFGLIWHRSVDYLERPEYAVGTPEYLSIQSMGGGDNSLDIRNDIYSIGVALFIALTHEYPYKGYESAYNDGNLRELFDSIKFGHVPNPSDLNSDIKPRLAEVIMTAIAKNIEDRFHTVAELKDAYLDAMNDY